MFVLVGNLCKIGFHRKDMHMPKLKNRPHKYCKAGKYAVVYHHGKTIYLGLYGSKESKIAHARFLAEIQANPTTFLLHGEKHVAIAYSLPTKVSEAFLNETHWSWSASWRCIRSSRLLNAFVFVLVLIGRFG